MTKLQAILHLYKTRRISEGKASLLAEEKRLTESEIEILESEIEKIKNTCENEKDEYK